MSFDDDEEEYDEIDTRVKSSTISVRPVQKIVHFFVKFVSKYQFFGNCLQH
jgi:hypothetical protein